MLKTQNYGFNKPELSDSPPDITVMNPNWDNIDKKIKENTDAIAQNSEAIGTVKTEITKMDMSWDKISGKPNSFVPSAHSHTKADIGLGSVQNYGVATQAQVDEGKANNLYVTPLSLAGLKQSVVNGKQAIVNAINDILGYNSGLTINNTSEEYSWWLKNKMKDSIDHKLYESVYNRIIRISGNEFSMQMTNLIRYDFTESPQYTFTKPGIYLAAYGSDDNAIRCAVLSGNASIRKIDGSSDLIYVLSAPCSVRFRIIYAHTYIYRVMPF